MSRRAKLVTCLGLVFATVLGPSSAAQELVLASRRPHFVAAWDRAAKQEVDISKAQVLVRRVSLNLVRVPLEVALEELANRAGLGLSYASSQLPAGRVVSLRADEITVLAALTEALIGSDLDVIVARDGQLALTACRHMHPTPVVQDSGTIVGRVTDKANESPLQGAAVVLEGTQLSTTTSSEGLYRITGVEPGTYMVRARYIGYSILSSPVVVEEGEELTVDFELEKSVQKLDEVVTTGTLIPTEVKALPTPVTIIDEEDIALHQPRTVQELFRQAVPGALSWDLTDRPETAAFSVRGASTLDVGSSQMKVFIDGVETAFPTFAAIDPTSIERVEVIRGPQAAAIYGSDAIGGVIQLFTKRGDPTFDRPRADVQAAFGIVQTPYSDFGDVVRQSYSGSVRGGTNDVSYNLGGGYSHTGDWLPSDEISRQSNPRVYGGMRFTRGVLSIDLSGRYTVTDAPSLANPEFSQTGFLDFSKPQYQRVRFTNQTAGVQVSLAARHWWQHTLAMGIDQVDQESVQSRARLTTPDDTLLSLFSTAFTKRSIGYNTSVQGTLTGGTTGALTVGFDHWSLPQSTFGTEGDATTGTLGGSLFANRTVTNNTGYFAQGQVGFLDALFLTGGLRAEQNTNFGDSLGTPVSPRVGLSYVRPLGNVILKLRGSWGRAIRAPDPRAKLSLGPGVLPNPELGPERQQGWDAGVDLAFGTRGSLNLTYYDQKAENLIQFVRVQNEPEPLDQFQNVGRVKNRGLEVEGSLSLGSLHIKGNYAFTRARVEELGPNYTGDLRVGEQVRATPKHTAGALLTATARQGTTVSAGLAYIGSFSQTDFLALFRCLGGTGPCTPDFTFVVDYPDFVKMNASVLQQITPQLSAFVAVNNLTNSSAAEFHNIGPVMGRITTLGFRAKY